MVTHDSSLARRVSRTVLIVDGEVVNEYVARALPSLSPQLMLAASHKVKPITFLPGQRSSKRMNPARIFTSSAKEMPKWYSSAQGGDVVADRLQPEQYFGEVSLVNCRRTIASVRAVAELPLEVLTLDAAAFQELLSGLTRFPHRDAQRSGRAHSPPTIRGRKRGLR